MGVVPAAAPLSRAGRTRGCVQILRSLTLAHLCSILFWRNLGQISPICAGRLSGFQDSFGEQARARSFHTAPGRKVTV